MAKQIFVVASLALLQLFNWKETKFLPFALRKRKGKLSGPNTSFEAGVTEVPEDSTVVEIGGDWIKSPKDFYYAAFAASCSVSNKSIPDYVVDYIHNAGGSLEDCQIVDPATIKVAKPTAPKLQLGKPSETKTVVMQIQPKVEKVKAKAKPEPKPEPKVEPTVLNEVEDLKAQIAELKALILNNSQPKVEVQEVQEPEVPAKPKKNRRKRRSSAEVAADKAAKAAEKAAAAAAKAAELMEVAEVKLQEELQPEPTTEVVEELPEPTTEVVEELQAEPTTEVVETQPEPTTEVVETVKPRLAIKLAEPKPISEAATKAAKPARDWGNGELTAQQKLHIAHFESEQAQIAKEVAKPMDEFRSVELQIRILQDRQAKIQALLDAAKKQRQNEEQLLAASFDDTDVPF